MIYQIKRWDNEAIIVRANLDGANLDGANLVRANLDGANGVVGFFCFGPIGSRKAYTWSRWEDGKYIVHCGCAHVDLDRFAEMVAEKHGDNRHGREYGAMIAMMRIRMSETKPDVESEKASV